MFILTHLNKSDYHIDATEIAVSDSEEKLASFIPQYKNMRKNHFAFLEDLGNRIRKQNKNQAKLRPFKLTSTSDFWPYTIKNFDHLLYRQNREQGDMFMKILTDREKRLGFTIVHELSERDEEFVISEIPCL